MHGIGYQVGSSHIGLDWIYQQDWDISGQIRQYKNRLYQIYIKKNLDDVRICFGKLFFVIK